MLFLNDQTTAAPTRKEKTVIAPIFGLYKHPHGLIFTPTSLAAQQ